MKSYVCITGAAGGLGKAFASECAQRGWDLVLTDMRSDLLPPLADGLQRQYNVRVRTFTCDLRDSAQREEFWTSMQEEAIQFFMLINVAGIDFEGWFKERSLEELRTMVRLNVEAVLEMTHSVLAHRDLCRTLRIINVSSLASFYPMPVKAVYAASKRFLLDLSRALYQELRGDDVSMTVLCPAGLPTTEGSITKINAQGMMGRVTTMNVGQVARYTIDQALKGRSLVIPGLLNQMLRFGGSLVPPLTLAGLLKNRWKKASSRHTMETISNLSPQSVD
ncbi:MAG: SDR family NAD(P)-dependent oxidoreductase [Anaerolineales bacterium]|nr:SDR family NAD(P)-dependent oxidoreductase [Anaerolineales bacterium]